MPATSSCTTPIPPWVARFVGIPFVAHGRDYDGCDCWGLLRLVWRDAFGWEAPLHDGPSWEPGTSADEISAIITRESARYPQIEPGSEKEGDGIVLRMRGGDMHIGVVVTPGRMLHVEEACATVVEDYRRPAWRHRIVRFHRFVS